MNLKTKRLASNESKFVLFGEALTFSFRFWVAWISFLYVDLFSHVLDWFAWCFLRIITNNFLEILLYFIRVLIVNCQVAEFWRFSKIFNDWIGFKPDGNVLLFDFLFDKSFLIVAEFFWLILLLDFTFNIEILSVSQHKL